MDASEGARRFAELYKAVYERFYRRVRHGSYVPSRESLALLRHLDSIGPLTVSEACRHFERSVATMSEILTRLETRGLIERRADERDRRRTLVWLTEDGLQAVRDAAQVLSIRLVEHALAQRTVDERKQILEGLESLLDTDRAERGWEDGGSQ